ncbi:MAG: HAMP domain-containing histidine kinase [Alphaproteobacteria bacterium]|nr:HAMP domain-containing histidine kinase [Alphaproteobacteria bacterium]
MTPCAKNWFFAVLLALMGLAVSAQARADDHTSEEWNFAEGPYHLKDGWTVYRDQIVNPADLLDTRCQTGAGAEAISVPDVWGPGFTATVATGHGKATYCREIILPEGEEAFAFYMGTLRSVSLIHAVAENPDGTAQTWLLFKNGELEPGGEQVVANPAVPMIPLPHATVKFTLVIQLSNYIHKQGGMIEVPTLDYRWRLAAAENRATAMPSALVIMLLFMGSFALIMGESKRTTLMHRYFAFLAIAAAVRAAFVSDLVWDYFPSFDLARKYDFEYLSLFIIAMAYYAFISHLLRPGKRMMVDYFVYASSGALAIFALFFAPFFAPGTITLAREPFQVLWIPITAMVIYAVFRATITHPENRREAMIVSFAGFGYGVYEVLSATGTIASSMEWSQFLIFLVMMMHAQAFVVQARRTERERDELLASLEDTNRDLQNRALALDLALQEAEQASNAKSHFLATFSHELRTPLNAILGFSELMERELFGKLGSPLYIDYMRDIHASGQHLLALVDDILDLSRIEAGVDELHVERVDISEVADEALKLLRLQAEQLQVSLKLERQRGLPRVLGDRRKIRQILMNLVTNAIKFNVEKGKVRIVMRLEDDGLYVDVSDTGLGIAEADLPVVLKRFGQADSERRQKNAGVGIGLPLSEVLMRQHDGKLMVDSKLGEGTTITLFFPKERLAYPEHVTSA